MTTGEPENATDCKMEFVGRFRAPSALPLVNIGVLREALRGRMELEQAAMRMVALCPHAEMVNIAATEAKRREAMMTPTDALRSVGDDLAAGRLK